MLPIFKSAPYLKSEFKMYNVFCFIFYFFKLITSGFPRPWTRFLKEKAGINIFNFLVVFAYCNAYFK